MDIFFNIAEAGTGALDWVKSLLRYRILSDIEKGESEPELFQNKDLFEYVKPVFREIQSHAKLGIDYRKLDYFSKARSALTESFRQEFDGIDWDYDADEQLKKSNFYRWGHEILVGLGTYSLLSKEGEARSDADNSNTDTSLFLTDVVNQFSLSFVALLEFYNSIQRGHRDTLWGWDWWESIPETHAKAMVTDSYVKRFFFVLLLRSFLRRRPSEKDIESLELRKHDVMSWFLNDQQFEQEFAQGIQDAKYAGINDDLSLLKDQFTSAIKKVVKDAGIRSELDLISKPISQERLNKVEQAFLKAFPESAKLRRLFSRHAVILSPEESSDLKWGINTLLPRDYLIDNPDIHFSDLGKQYGTDLGSSENEYIFSKLSQMVEISSDGDYTPTKALDHLLSQNVAIEDTLIIGPWLPKGFLNIPGIEYRQHYSRVGAGEPDGTLTYKNASYSVYLTFIRQKEEDRSHFMILDRKAVTIGWTELGEGKILGNTHFFLDAKDPLVDKDLAKNIVERKSEWLLEYPENLRSKMIGKFVWMRILEGIDLKANDTKKVFKFAISEPVVEVPH